MLVRNEISYKILGGLNCDIIEILRYTTNLYENCQYFCNSGKDTCDIML